MIQRIQTVYVILVTLLLVVTMFSSIGTLVNVEGEVMNFKNYGLLTAEGLDSSTWGMMGILILSSFISFITVFLYKNRILQIRMTVFNTILLIGYYITFLVFMYVLQKRYMAEFHLSWALGLPLVAIILNYLAIRAIGKDEVLVKAADRLR